MRYLRAKHIRKALRQYHFLCGIKESYKVILDGNFIAMCLRMKVALVERLTKFIQASKPVTFYVVEESVRELEALGLSDAVQLSKRFQVLRTSVDDKNANQDSSTDTETSSKQTLHTSTKAESVNDAILNLIGQRNQGKYFVATQDVELRKALREIPGVPLVYLNRSVLVFEDISSATLQISRKEDHERQVKLGNVEAKQLELIKKQEFEKLASDPAHPPRRPKKAKAPNPLSCKPKTSSKKKVRSKKKSVIKP